MPALPRATCPVCARSVAVRREGEIREHRNPPIAEHTAWGMDDIPGRICRGSGQVTSESSAAAKAAGGPRQFVWAADSEGQDQEEHPVDRAYRNRERDDDHA